MHFFYINPEILFANRRPRNAEAQQKTDVGNLITPQLSPEIPNHFYGPENV